MSNPAALEVQSDAAILEQVVATGNLASLSAEQRVNYYRSICDSLGLNALTQPFQYITLKGKLTLYARKDATDQLRSIKGISIDKPDITFEDDWIIVAVVARDAAGRTDSDIGVVNKKDMENNFGNALMKAVTKAKRRVTLSICGLGMLDETEIETIPSARPVVVNTATGEIVESTTHGYERPLTQADKDEMEKRLEAKASTEKITEAQIQKLAILIKELYPKTEDMEQVRKWMTSEYGVQSRKDLSKSQASAMIDTLEKQKNGEPF